ncbi:immunoglobulin I-set domain protein [Cooperia oncophora]
MSGYWTGSFVQVIKAYRILSTDTPTLVVEVASDPPAIFEWFCNDKSVQQDRRRFQARHGLNITTLTVHEPEQGVYKCTARNPAGTSTSYGYITVNCELTCFLKGLQTME